MASLLFEFWPIPCIALTAWLYRGQDRYQNLDRPTLLLIAAGTPGAALAVASQHGTLLHLERTDSVALAAGTALALLSAALTAGGAGAAAAASLRWGTLLNRNLLYAHVPIRHGPQAELLGACTASLIADVIVVPLCVTLALLAQENTPPLLFAAAAVGAALCHGLPSLLWYLPTYLTTNPSLHALSYTTPVIAVSILLLTGWTHVARPELLIAGTAAVATANTLLHVRRSG